MPPAGKTRWYPSGLLVLILVLVWLPVRRGLTQEPASWSPGLVRGIQTYCLDCHDATTAEAGLDLTALLQGPPAGRADSLRQVLDALDFREMPPVDAPQPTAAERAEWIQTLRQALQHLAPTVAYPPTPIRRMNRFQYNNAVTDLFELQCVVFTLPERMMRDHSGYFQPQSGRMPDVVTVGSRPLGKSQMIERRLAGVAAFPQDLRAEHGFDNQADHLSLSPLLMEAFLKLGESITQSPDFVPRNVGIWKRFFAPPAGSADTSEVLTGRLRPFLTRAFRRPVDSETLQRYVGYVQGQLAEDVPFPEAMKNVAAAVIASPRFLYLYDRADSGTATGTVDDFELASRLSFFLWGSLPDEQLLELAERQTLSQPHVLREEAVRMLQDRRLKRFCDSFPAQWLQLERIISATPSRELFPDFYYLKYRDSMHMMLEPLLLFETVLIENLPVTHFLDADFSYRSNLLEEAYGELASNPQAVNQPGGQVGPLKFRRVALTDRRTGGLITNAAVMTMTSGTERTKPITRGAWIASVIFNHPPQPPPADVPPLAEHPSGAEQDLTLRERIAAHRQRSDCRGCHEKIDPLGFALENYDVIGRWRDRYENERPVDMSGSLFRQHEFQSVVEFKDALLSEKDRFSRGLAAHLLSFALARKLGAADQAAVDHIVERTAEDGDRLQTMILEVVLSPPFAAKSPGRLDGGGDARFEPAGPQARPSVRQVSPPQTLEQP